MFVRKYHPIGMHDGKGFEFALLSGCMLEWFHDLCVYDCLVSMNMWLAWVDLMACFKMIA